MSLVLATLTVPPYSIHPKMTVRQTVDHILSNKSAGKFVIFSKKATLRCSSNRLEGRKSIVEQIFSVISDCTVSAVESDLSCGKGIDGFGLHELHKDRCV